MFKKNNLNDGERGENPSNAEATNVEESTNPSSNGRKNNSVLTELASLFECPVCNDYVLPPILQCSSGHLVCVLCRSKLTHCPTCRNALTPIRNLAMEQVAKKVNFPSDCNASLVEIDYEEIIKCPCPGVICQWEGPLYLILQHLMSSHIATILIGNDIIFFATNISTPGSVNWMMMQKCFGLHFLLVLEKKMINDHEQFFALVQLIGTRQQAKKFVYRLELNGEKRRLLAWEATPLSIHDRAETAIRDSDCLMIDTPSAKSFIDNEDNIKVCSTISLV